MSEDNKDDYIKKEENNSELEKQSEVDENSSTDVENPPSDFENPENRPSSPIQPFSATIFSHTFHTYTIGRKRIREQHRDRQIDR